MSDVLKGYPATQHQGGKRSSCGGDMTGYVKPLPYKTPVGPKGQSHNSPGLGGTNHGNSGTQGKR